MNCDSHFADGFHRHIKTILASLFSRQYLIEFLELYNRGSHQSAFLWEYPCVRGENANMRGTCGTIHSSVSCFHSSKNNWGTLRPPNSLSNSVYGIFSNEMRRKFPFLKLLEGKHEEKSTNNQSKILILKRAKRFRAKRGHTTRGVVSEGGWGPNFLDFYPWLSTSTKTWDIFDISIFFLKTNNSKNS